MAAGALIAVALGILAAVGNGAETGEQPPINDNYLQSLNLNQPGTPLNRVDTLTDTRDTSLATVQSDIFDPPETGGPAEVTGCEGVGEGKTIWYDFYPDANGLVRIRTSAGFGTVMAVMPYDPKTLMPEIGERKCAVNLVGKAKELFDEVTAHRDYTIQIGGVEGAGGEVQFLFDYLVHPRSVNAEATLAAEGLSSGLRVVSLSVSAPKGARVTVRCTRGCGVEAKTARTVHFPKLGGTVLPNGAALRISVTAHDEVGTFIEYKVRGNSFVKSRRCLPPGSSKPVRCE